MLLLKPKGNVIYECSLKFPSKIYVLRLGHTNKFMAVHEICRKKVQKIIEGVVILQMRPAGIEPAASAWQAPILPLNHER